MDKRSWMLNIAQRLQQASAQSDWQALSSIDAELAVQVLHWGGVAGWTPAELRALSVLTRIQQEAAQRCGNELKGLAQRLADINTQQGRWTAYAQSSDWEDGL